ncbi:40S ribosomal protein S13 [Senna tora]|uniref:40S ribosomal protein S13 n=1 Tax=Senna tora TaxID=362788 RepID=A0A834SUV5_9FABA|nr:40S ribosomal protein S13 [Senna tora]
MSSSAVSHYPPSAVHHRPTLSREVGFLCKVVVTCVIVVFPVLFFTLPFQLRFEFLFCKNKSTNEFARYSLFPHWWELLSFLVIASKSVNSAFHKNQPELGVLVLQHEVVLF